MEKQITANLFAEGCIGTYNTKIRRISKWNT